MNSLKYDPSINSSKAAPISRPFRYYWRLYRSHILVSLCILPVLVVYVWLISFGTWLKWPVVTNYYDQLATAFEHRSLSLETKPNQALLALSDPYDPAERAGISFLKDASLYKGHYYLYFGPIPALILAVLKYVGLGRLGDQYLVFAFVSGILIFQSMLIFKVWRLFFRDIPIWILLVCILLGGLISPFTWVLTQARIYEAAASGGEFFFLAGFYFIVTALERKCTLARCCFIFGGGVSLALAIGSRLTQILPVGFLTVMIALLLTQSCRQNKTLPQAMLMMMLLGSPLVVGMAALGRYNWARFHSVFETGLYYQLAGSDLQKYTHVLFSPLYILPNLYDYLFMPPHIYRTFPFLKPVHGAGASLFSFITLPPVYYNTELTGILVSTPFVLFAGVSILSLALKKKNLPGSINPTGDFYSLQWLTTGMLGTVLFGFAPLVSFFWVAMHYQIDFIPPLIVLSMIGFWQGHRLTTHRPSIHKLYVAGGMILMLVSVVSDILLAFSAHAATFQKVNPLLWKYLISIFSR